MKFIHSILQLVLLFALFFTLFKVLGDVVVLTELAPVSLFSAAWLFIIVSLGGGWPLSPPLGDVRRYGRTVSGALMSLLWAVASVGSFLVVRLVVGEREMVVYGMMLLLISAFWGVVFGSWPLRHHKPSTALLISALSVHVLVLILTLLIRIDFDRLTGLTIHSLSWAFLLSPPFLTQAYHFRRLRRQPRVGVAITVLTLLLTLLSWEIVVNIFRILEEGLANVFMSSMIFWSVVYSWSFSFAGLSRFVQPTRGYIALIITMILAALWSLMLNLVFSWRVAVFFNLSAMLVALTVHNVFWLGAPFSPPLVLGMPPTYQRKMSLLEQWYEQVRK